MGADKDIVDIAKLLYIIKQQRKSVNSHDIAVRTEELLENLIANGAWKDAEELKEQIKKRISFVMENAPHEAIAINVMRHLLKIISGGSNAEAEDEQSLHHIVTSNPNVGNPSEDPQQLKSNLLDVLSEYKTELEQSSENIANQASEHIHANEVIMTYGRSKTVEKFLKSAYNPSKKRVFSVIVAEGGPLCPGHGMAESLSDSKIQTTLIPDTAIFAMMSRVNKVIIGTHTVLANGGLRAAIGTHIVALAAKRYSVPVMVLSHMYKFSPLHVGSPDDESFNILASPAEVLPYSSGMVLNKVDVVNPVFDYVPPELVTLLISPHGGYAPSYVYRLLSELYRQEDYDI